MTERLSEKNPCINCADRQIGNPNIQECGCDSCDRPIDWKNECVKKLEEYETAEEDGRLLVLPCKVGDIVWLVHQEIANTIYYTISKMNIIELRGNRMNPIWFIIDGEYGRTSFSPSEIGKTVFLTKEEAENALSNLKE